MSEFTFAAKEGKRIAKILDAQGVEYSLTGDFSAMKNEVPSNHPGNFGNDVMITINVHDSDVELLEKIHAEASPVREEQEVSGCFRLSENYFVKIFKKLSRPFGP